jgi:hypothetical protein
LKFLSRGSIISAHSANPGGGVYSVKISAVPGFLFFKNQKKLSGYTLLEQAEEKPGPREKPRYGIKGFENGAYSKTRLVLE